MNGPPMNPPDEKVHAAFWRLLAAATARSDAARGGEMVRAVDLATMGELDRAARAYGAAWGERKK